MTNDQWTILAIMLGTMLMFLFGRWRHDMVAFGALLACVLASLVDPTQAFSGFGHPAVVTVACVLVLSQSLQNSGAVDVLARSILPTNAGQFLTLLMLMGLGALLSGFMNNVGAMALLMPVAIQLTEKLDLTPGQILMPLAFGTILGGMTTLIGTPPNLIVAGFREEAGLGSFSMFDFTPIGLAIALAGVVFIALVGWRLVPIRQKAGVEGFESGAYLTELRVGEASAAAGLRIREVEEKLTDVDVQIVGIVKNDVRIMAPNPWRQVQVDDIIILEADADALSDILSILGLELEQPEEPEKELTALERKEMSGDEPKADKKSEKKHDDEVSLMEFVVLPSSRLIGRLVYALQLQARYGINVLALSREGEQKRKRLRSMQLQSGDLLLLQGQIESMNQFAADNGCIPLAQRDLRIPNKRDVWVSSLIMLLAVALAAFGIMPAVISFSLGVLASLALGTIKPRKVYDCVDWSVIVLLGALIPVASAIESTGTADIIARLMIDNIAQGSPVIGLALILVVTMFLSDLMNNAATAAVMCPIALGTSSALGVSPDSFLMAVAIGASCAFLTPIGHQNNTLILGPGGFKFSDYWRLGLPLEILVIAISMPLLLLIWPL
ncbi:SLC13 family permease [Vibrio agarivorans]|uniref:SLC13 family permease n=1 Tax=Vibrio agarivorans TaxID=153622 RepID=A0ABT7XXF7_9VIBR|nr:SLC13 family permease [Vibrio agarivorans]MDN2480460.1 SLC13 family permease [Vibrio agarivorans]